jgi:hypothetical protein
LKDIRNLRAFGYQNRKIRRRPNLKRDNEKFNSKLTIAEWWNEKVRTRCLLSDEAREGTDFKGDRKWPVQVTLGALHAQFVLDTRHLCTRLEFINRLRQVMGMPAGKTVYEMQRNKRGRITHLSYERIYNFPQGYLTDNRTMVYDGTTDESPILRIV